MNDRGSPTCGADTADLNERRIYDIGHGVEVIPEGDDGWSVRSQEIYLHWHPQCADFPGTAVGWLGELYEAERVETLDRGWRWRLVPWQEGQVARTVTYLGVERVQELAETRADDARRRQKRNLLVWLLPLSGALPRLTQERLEREVNFPASRATFVSALCEFVLGGYTMMQSLLLMAGGGWIMPPFTRWLVVFSPIFFIEGFARLRQSVRVEPIGSLFLAPLGVLEKRQAPGPRPEDYRPTALNWDPAGDELELATVEPRSDWVIDEVLRFRGRPYRLLTRAGRFERVIYRFEAAPAGTPATLQLKPPWGVIRPQAQRQGAGCVETVWRTTLMALAPRALQERWFEGTGTNPVVVTAGTAAVEVLGAVINLLGDPAAGLWHVLDLVVLGDGLYRLGVAAVRRTAAGSLLGLPLMPLYRAWVGSLGAAAPPPGGAVAAG